MAALATRAERVQQGDYSVTSLPMTGAVGQQFDTCTARRPLCTTFSISAAAIPADKLDTWMIPQPLGERCRGPIGQNVDHHAAFQVDDDTTVRAPFTQRPVIHTKIAQCRRSCGWCCTHQPEHRIATRRTIKITAQPCRRDAAQGQAEGALLFSKTLGPARPWCCYLWQALREDSLRAGAVAAKTLPYLQAQADSELSPCEIG